MQRSDFVLSGECGRTHCVTFYVSLSPQCAVPCSHLERFRNKVGQELEQDGICAPKRQGNDGLEETPAPG